MIDPEILQAYYHSYHGRYANPIMKCLDDHLPGDTPGTDWAAYYGEFCDAVNAFTGKPTPPPKPPEPPFEWKPHYRERLRFFIRRLTAGLDPSQEMIDAWLDGESEDLQEWVANRIPDWALGISVIEAAEKIVIEGVKDGR